MPSPLRRLRERAAAIADRAAAGSVPPAGQDPARPPDAQPTARDRAAMRRRSREPGRTREAPTWRLPAAIVGTIVLLAGAGLAIALGGIARDAEEESSRALPTQTVTTVAPGRPGPLPSRVEAGAAHGR